MEIYIYRTKQNSHATLGVLNIIDPSDTTTYIPEDKKLLFSCYTLENANEGIERNKDLRVPQGTYGARWHDSNQFKGQYLHIFNSDVPKDRYILIHAGNTQKDTLGCILLGMKLGKDAKSIEKSRDAMNMFHSIVKKANISDIRVRIVNKL